jgi:hypothetical protein
MFKARNLVKAEADMCGTHVDEGLYVEAVPSTNNKGQTTSPKRVIFTTNIAVRATPDVVHQLGKPGAFSTAGHGNAGAAAVGDDGTAFREIGTGEQSGDKPRNLGWVDGPVAVFEGETWDPVAMRRDRTFLRSGTGLRKFVGWLGLGQGAISSEVVSQFVKSQTLAGKAKGPEGSKNKLMQSYGHFRALGEK